MAQIWERVGKTRLMIRSSTFSRSLGIVGNCFGNAKRPGMALVPNRNNDEKNADVVEGG